MRPVIDSGCSCRGKLTACHEGRPSPLADCGARRLNNTVAPAGIRNYETPVRAAIARRQKCKRPLESGLLLFPKLALAYGASLLILVAQFPSDVRVEPQEPNPAVDGGAG